MNNKDEVGTSLKKQMPTNPILWFRSYSHNVQTNSQVLPDIFFAFFSGDTFVSPFLFAFCFALDSNLPKHYT